MGIFALTVNGGLTITVRCIRLANGIVEISGPSIGECRQHLCAAGMTDIPDEYLLAKTERARDETYPASSDLLNRMRPEMAKVVRITDLTIAHDKMGTVGGKIDALELVSNGSFRWIQQKENCPENED